MLPLERELAQKVRKVFAKQEKMLLDALELYKDKFPLEEADYPVSPIIAAWKRIADSTRETFEEGLTTTLTKAISKGMGVVADDMGVTAAAFNVRNPRAVDYLKEHGADNVTRINDVTRDRMRTILEQGREGGWSYDRVADEIRREFANYYSAEESKWEFNADRSQLHITDRASLIAVTEIGNAYEEGGYQQALEMQNAGLPVEKYWQTANDDRVSDGCAENEAEGWIPFDDQFASGDEHPLRFPGCRCACQYRMAKELVAKKEDKVPEEKQPSEMKAKIDAYLEEYDKFMQENDARPYIEQLNILVPESIKVRKSGDEEKLKGMLAEINRLHELEFKIREDVYNKSKEINEMLRETLRVANPSTLTSEYVHSDDKKIKQALEKFNLYVDAGLTQGNPLSIMVESGLDRAFYSDKYSMIGIPDNRHPSYTARTTHHELGHWIEGKNANVHEALVNFFNDRTKHEEFVKLSDLFPNEGYDDNEVTKKDSFIDPYMGKVYDNGTTEILSMGIERYIDDPLEFARRDREHFEIVRSILAGEL
jgi:hypothetical protein